MGFRIMVDFLTITWRIDWVKPVDVGHVLGLCSLDAFVDQVAQEDDNVWTVIALGPSIILSQISIAIPPKQHYNLDLKSVCIPSKNSSTLWWLQWGSLVHSELLEVEDLRPKEWSFVRTFSKASSKRPKSTQSIRCTQSPRPKWWWPTCGSSPRPELMKPWPGSTRIWMSSSCSSFHRLSFSELGTNAFQIKYNRVLSCWHLN